jgi:hypothetical protein
MTKMKSITPDQIKKISTLISRQNLGDFKDTLVDQFTGGRTTSRKQMFINEATDLIQFLIKDDPCTKMRNKVFAIAHNMKWLYKGMHDLNRMIIDRFLLKRGAVKKPIAKMNEKELVLVVTQFVSMQNKEELRAFGETVLAEVLSELNIDKATGRNPQSNQK